MIYSKKQFKIIYVSKFEILLDFKIEIISFRLKAVEIWSEYISYSIGEMCQENGVDKIRSLCERACSLPGFEYSKGNFIWGAYRDFERAILSGYQVNKIDT